MRQWRTFLKAQQLQRAFSTSQLLTLMVNIGQQIQKSMNLLCLLFPAGNKTVLAENTFFPSNFTDVDLPEAKLTAAGFQLSDSNVVRVNQIPLNLITVVMLC